MCHERLTCPECGERKDPVLDSESGGQDKVLKSSDEEIVLEVVCRSNTCDRVWRAVYSYTGNE